jgi:glycosyltransferase involved in cell wall biosynthesis
VRILAFTSLYPSEARPRHGIFVETRLLQLQRCVDVDVRVVAPVPWFPSRAERFGDYAVYARTPRREIRGGNSVSYPRYLALPIAGMYLHPFTMAEAGIREYASLSRSGYACDLIDAHYLYPDGVAAAILARRIGKPLVITARGTDVNRLTQFAVPRRLILWSARQAQALITVSGALKDKLVSLGVDGARITVLRNGVDLERFREMPRAVARRRAGLPDGHVVLSVGNLVAEKGHELAIGAIAELPGVRLAIVGDGPLKARLKEQAERMGLAARIHFLGVYPQSELPWLYSAADALVLASSREGWPNVLLESMACGTPVVAVDVGGVREIVTDDSAGRIVGDRSVGAIAASIRSLLADAPSRAATRSFAERFDWTATSQGQMRVFSEALNSHAGGDKPASVAKCAS